MPGVVKFKYEYSTDKIQFLDLEIQIENGTLETNLFVKPTNAQLFLDYFSNHPQPCKEGIIYGEALRIVERCSKDEDKVEHLAKLNKKFEERGYPKKLIAEKFQMAESKERKDLVNQARKKKKFDGKTRLIFTYNAANPPLHMWLRECKKLLVKNEKAKQLGDNIQIGYKQPKNVQSIVRSHSKSGGDPGPPNAEVTGCSNCKKCHACPILKEGRTFSSTNTQRTYRIMQNVTCDSTFVIYLATCKKCGGQYVGKTKNKFKQRHSGHKQEIKRQYGGLGHHYGGTGCGYENISIMVIEQVEIGNHEELGDREIYWQNQLRAFVENGGNAHCYRKEKSK